MARKKRTEVIASSVSRTKILVYKRARSNIEPRQVNLQELLRAAWLAAPKVKDRKRSEKEDEASSDSAETTFFFAYHRRAPYLDLYELWSLTPGQSALGAEIDDEKDELETEDVQLVGKEGKLLEMVENVAHIGVCENDVVVLSGRGIRTLDIEVYINWFLTSTAALTDGSSVLLANKPSPSIEKKLAGVRSIDLDGCLRSSPPAEDAHQTGTTIRWRRLLPLLTGAFGSVGKGLVSSLTHESLNEDTPINLRMRLSWTPPKNKDKHEVIDAIAVGLRNVVNELDYTIYTKNGPVKKDQIVLRKPKRIKCIKQRPTRDSVTEVMMNWLVELKQSGALA